MVIYLGGPEVLLIGWSFQVPEHALSPSNTYTGLLRFGEKILAHNHTP